jgi:hypothetical protein
MWLPDFGGEKKLCTPVHDSEKFSSYLQENIPRLLLTALREEACLYLQITCNMQIGSMGKTQCILMLKKKVHRNDFPKMFI